MQTIEEVRQEALKLFEGIRDGKIPHKEAKEMNNAIGKIVGTIRVQLDYAELREEIPNIDFLNHQKGTKKK